MLGDEKNVFRLNPNAFKQVRNRVITRTLVLGITAAVVGVYIAFFSNSSEPPDLALLLIMAPVLLIIVLGGLFVGLARQKEQWNTFELTVDDETITRTQKNMPIVQLSRKGVEEIIDGTRGNIEIKTDKAEEFITIPNGIERRAELLNILSQIGRIKSQEVYRPWWQTAVPSIITLGLLVVFFGSKHQVVTVVSGLILLVGLTYALVSVLRSSNVDSISKRTSLILIIFLIGVAVRLFIEFSEYYSLG